MQSLESRLKRLQLKKKEARALRIKIASGSESECSADYSHQLSSITLGIVVGKV